MEHQHGAQRTTLSDPRVLRLLPHEWICGTFFVFMWMRLIFGVGFFRRDSMFFLLLLALNVAVLVYRAAQETTFRWKISLLFYPVSINLVYYVLATAIPTIHPRMEDLRSTGDRKSPPSDCSAYPILPGEDG